MRLLWIGQGPSAQDVVFASTPDALLEALKEPRFDLVLLVFPSGSNVQAWPGDREALFALLRERLGGVPVYEIGPLGYSGELFRALTENSRELVFVIDAEGRIRYASPNVDQVLGYDPLGYTREEIHVLDFIPPQDRPYAEAALEDLLRHPGEVREYRAHILDAQGRARVVRVWGKNLLQDPVVRGIVLNVRDETELEEERARLAGILEALPGQIFQARVEEGQDPAYAPLVYTASRQVEALLGHPAEALLKDPGFYFAQVHPEDRARLEETGRRAVAEPGTLQTCTYRFLHGKKKTWVWLRDTLVYDPEARLLTGYTYDVTEEQAQEQALRESEALFRTLAETAPALILLWQPDDPQDPASARLTFANRAAQEITGYTLEELQSRPVWDLVHPQDRPLVRERGLAHLRGENSLGRYTFRVLTQSGGVRWLDYSAARVEIGGKPAVLGVGLDVTEAKERERTLEAFALLSLALRKSEDPREMMEEALDVLLEVMEAEAGSILLYEEDPPRLVEHAARGWIRALPAPPRPEEKSLVARALRGEVVLSPNLREDPRVREAARPQIPEGWSGMAHPLLAGTEPVGVLLLAWPGGRLPTPSELERAQVLADTLGNAVHRAILRQKLAKGVEQLEALRRIDQAVLASLGLEPSLEVLLGQVFLVPVDAAALFLLEPGSRTLRLAAHRGFRLPPPKEVPLGQGHLGRAALLGEEAAVDASRREHRVDLGQDPGAHSEFALREGLRSERVYPLIARGKVVGVLALFTRRPWDLSPEDEDYLRVLAGQGALALDSLRTLEDLLKTQRALEAAYELTLWGWAKAVELRDQETAGHTERVTELTLRLARALGVPEEELDPIRRGAILHDIGKIAIPDAILLKPGPLTEEEWAVMKKHPVYAYEWLSGIPFLKKALEIPYLHHERWDGSGYPLGLKGREIPLSARIFAVADVYDALSSDRPYRKAWPREKALAYLKEQAGRLFDPEVVAAFLDLEAGSS